MGGNIYLLQEGGELVAMAEEPYDSEDLLQRLLADYPSLMAGDQIDTAEPRRWLLVSREAGVPSHEGGGAQWSLDHLFLDQDAIPTLVEVKRSSDTRIRREVVGQMLDYAANAVVYWPIDKIRAQFESTCQNNDRDPERVLADFLNDSDQEEFWQRTKTNLQAGRVRMVFVADEIPSELRRVVEFLNSQMEPAEVLAVEIKQFVGQEMKTLVPRVVGLTAEAQQKKRPEGRPWDEPRFFKELASKASADEVRVARRIFEWAQANDIRIWWGKGQQSGSFFLMLDHNDTAHWVGISVWTYGRAQTQFGTMKSRPPFDDDGRRKELLRRLNEIPGVALPEEAVDLWRSIPLSTFEDEGALKQLLSVLDWIVAEVRAS